MHRKILTLWIPLILLTALLSGCAYYNTFHNAKRKFAEAERDNRNPALQQRTQPQQQPQSPAFSGRPTQPGQPQPPQQNIQSADKYRKVVETCSKLLEFYPRSRWVDDALMLMGKSYYRLKDYPRAERKFTELLTLFPKSKHAQEALIWKTRVLADDGEIVAAVDFLASGMSKLRSGVEQADAHRLLGSLYLRQELWADAAEHFKRALEHKLPRDEQATTQIQYGQACFSQAQFTAARDAFARAARLSRDAAQAYRASILWSRCELALGNTVQAEEILEQLSRARIFAEYADDVALELANLALSTGRYDDAIALYEKFTVDHSSGETRGIAFYRLALIHRDQRADLTLSKALLDSALRSGATGSIADSARLALDQISKGLLALEKIVDLEQQIRELNSGSPRSRAVPDSAGGGSNQPEAPPVDSLSMPGASTDRTEAEESASESGLAAQMESSGLPPAEQPSDSSVPPRRERMSPAALAADSILRALQIRDSTRGIADSATMTLIPDTVMAASSPAPPDTPHADETPALAQKLLLRRQLQVAYLHAAEFYNYSLADRDSALYYYRLAAATALEPQVYWKANLFLAQAASPTGDSVSTAAAEYYRAVVAADSVPREAANLARAALDLPLIEPELRPQAAAAKRVQELHASSAVVPDSLLIRYAEVAAMDSFTNEAKTALFAMAHILEYDLARYDAARSVYDRIMQTFPDSAFVTWIRKKLEPPDSTSIFNVSDSVLAAIVNPPETFLELEPEGGAWPPPEESLRGRRYRK